MEMLSIIHSVFSEGGRAGREGGDRGHPLLVLEGREVSGLRNQSLNPPEP